MSAEQWLASAWKCAHSRAKTWDVRFRRRFDVHAHFLPDFYWDALLVALDSAGKTCNNVQDSHEPSICIIQMMRVALQNCDSVSIALPRKTGLGIQPIRSRADRGLDTPVAPSLAVPSENSV